MVSLNFKVAGYSFQYFSRLKPHLHALKKRHARQIFGTVLMILRRATLNFGRVNVLVPNVMWHRWLKF